MSKNVVINSKLIYDQDNIQIEKCLDFPQGQSNPKAPAIVFFHGGNDGRLKWGQVDVKVGKDPKKQTIHVFERSPDFIDECSKRFPGSEIYFLSNHTNDTKTRTFEENAEDFEKAFASPDLYGKKLIAIAHSISGIGFGKFLLRQNIEKLKQIKAFYSVCTPWGFVGKKMGRIGKIVEPGLSQDPMAGTVVQGNDNNNASTMEFQASWNSASFHDSPPGEGPYVCMIAASKDDVVSKRSACGLKPDGGWKSHNKLVLPTKFKERRFLGGAHRTPMGPERKTFFQGPIARAGGGNRKLATAIADDYYAHFEGRAPKKPIAFRPSLETSSLFKPRYVNIWGAHSPAATSKEYSMWVPPSPPRSSSLSRV